MKDVSSWFRLQSFARTYSTQLLAILAHQDRINIIRHDTVWLFTGKL